jgi:hypothetical protein
MIFGKLIVITLFAIVAIVIFTLVLGTWIISRAARTATRVIGGMVGVPQPRFSRYVPVSTPATLRCPQPRCHAENRAGARFCRRCGMVMNGQAVAAAQRVNVRRRAAMW